MGGFMPLIEAFLAFALTMLALAAAVSAVVGVWLRLFRWRAYGLRQSLETMYDAQIEPRLTEVRGSPPGPDDRLAFIADMTFALNLQSGTQGPDVRQRRLAELATTLRRPAVEGRSQDLPSPLLRRLRHWRSLRFGVDHLSDSQFRVRLDASQAGRTLRASMGDPEWERVKNWLTDYFNEIGVVATESFARRSRTRTVIAGLLLAVAVNIDSFDLLNTYMTDEEARRAVIAQQNEILKQDVPAQGDVAGSPWYPGDYGESVDSAIDLIDRSLADLDASQLSDTVDAETAERLSAALETVRRDLAGASEAAAGFEAAVSTTQGIAAGLTKSFPVGWDGYPNCTAVAADLRCARLAALPALRAAHADATLIDRLGAVAALDSPAFLKWLVGVLLTGFMVGLGAPFWVQAVDRLLKLKESVGGATGSSSRESGAPGAAGDPGPPAPPAAPARGGAVARAAADKANASLAADTPASTRTEPQDPSAAGVTARRAADDAIGSADGTKKSQAPLQPGDS